MDVSQLNRSRVNESRVNCSVLNASGFDGACRRSRVPGIGADIMKSMVLWYDIAKQGATNENMAENPVLRDLSGNGHDATCYNFAWSGMSGVDGYSENYNNYAYYDSRATIIRSSDGRMMNITKITETNSFLELCPSAGNVNGYQVSVTGISEVDISIRYQNDNDTLVTISSDGIYTIPKVENGNWVGFRSTGVVDSCNITIEQLPLYPHALVSDGVDDYCLVEGLPLLNKEDGYTVIAKRKIIDLNKSALASRRTASGNENSAFQFEREIDDNKFGVLSYTALSYVELWKDDVTFQTIQSYNGTPIEEGSNTADNPILLLYGFSSSISVYAQCAIYSFLFFNRELTPEEIEWVKTNLIETEQ